MIHKLEGSDIWEIYGPDEDRLEMSMESDQKERTSILDEIQNWLISNSVSLKLFYESEDGKCMVTMRDLQVAVSQANTDELKRFAQTKRIFYEDGYIVVED